MDDNGQQVDVEPSQAIAVGRAEQGPRVQIMPADPTPDGEMRLAIISHSAEIGELFGALAAAQAEFGEIEKTLEAKVESRRTDTKFTYQYETLNDVLGAVRPALAKNGLAVMQFPFTRKNSVVVKTLIGHKSGQWITNDLTASIAGTDPQSVGSGISYMRRYGLKALLGVAPGSGEDDDGAAAFGRGEPPKPAQRKSEQAAAKPVPSPVGTIEKVHEKGGAVLVELHNGYVCSTRDPELIAVAKKHVGSGVVFEFVTRPSSDPSKYAPVLTEIMTQQCAE
mgnify:FL=1